MLKRLSAGLAIAAYTTRACQSQVGAQQGAAAQGPDHPTDRQMAESQEAPRHIAAATALAKPDLLEEAKVMCTATAPRSGGLSPAYSLAAPRC